MSKESRFRGPCDKQHRKRSYSLLKSASHQLYHIHWSLPSQLRLKKSVLLTCKILGLLVNSLAGGGNYPVLNIDKLTIPLQMQLSQKQNTFPEFLAAFLKYWLIFKYFEKKDDPHRFCISEITDSKNVVRKMSKKFRFRWPFDKTHRKRAQTLLKSAWQELYHVH